MCIIFWSLFAYRHGRSIITWRRWIAKGRKLYRTTERTEKRCGCCEKGISELWRTAIAIQFFISTEYFLQTHQRLHVPRNQMSPRNMIFLIFIGVTAISYSVHGSLPIPEHVYSLMHFTQLISEEHFTAGRPLVKVLPLAEEDSTNNEVGYLFEGMHTSGRWSILVYNVSHKMSRNIYTEIHPHGSYIILISGPVRNGKNICHVTCSSCLKYL